MTCGWPVDRTCLPDLPDENDPDYDMVLADRTHAENTAVYVLWSLTGRQFTNCDVIVRPCPAPSQPQWRPGSSYDQTVPPWSPMFAYGRWSNVGCGCVGRCTVAGPKLIHLPPEASHVSEVRIAGAVLDPVNYVQEGNRLYRRDAPWPSQNLSLPLGEEGTWSVTYTGGTPPPPFVAKIVGSLAREMMIACTGNKCRIPRTVVSTSRGGVSHVFDPSRMLTLGFTGLEECDGWIAAVNPNRLQSGPRVR